MEIAVPTDHKEMSIMNVLVVSIVEMYLGTINEFELEIRRKIKTFHISWRFLNKQIY